MRPSTAPRLRGRPRAAVLAAAPSPLYEQIKDALRGRILDGRYAPHERMPSEAELTASFGVSRITVRQALGDLQNEGLIFRVHGKGTYVTQAPKAYQDLAQLQGFGEAMSRIGYEALNRVIDFRFVRAPRQVAAHLDIADDTVVTEIRRVRLVNRMPVSLDVSYLSEAIGKRLQKADLVTRDIFLILESDLGLSLGNADLKIEAIVAPAGIARPLGIATGSPLLRIERLTHTAQGQPLDFEYLHHRADAFQYRLTVERKPRSA